MRSPNVARSIRFDWEHLFDMIAATVKLARRDWLMLFASFEGAPDGLDPIRVQKGLFLFAMRGAVDESEQYTFKPYDYGPMSASIYTDLDALAEERLLERLPVPGKNWSRYRPTEAGLQRGIELLELAINSGRLAAAQQLHQIKQEVSSVGFNDLLERVYSEYPEYASNSVFRRRA